MMPGTVCAIIAVLPGTILDLLRAGLTTLNQGQQIEYEEVANKGKTSAENLKVKR
jgi:hypothetical protein